MLIVFLFVLIHRLRPQLIKLRLKVSIISINYYNNRPEVLGMINTEVTRKGKNYVTEETNTSYTGTWRYVCFSYWKNIYSLPNNTLISHRRYIGLYKTITSVESFCWNSSLKKFCNHHRLPISSSTPNLTTYSTKAVHYVWH